VVNQIIAGSVLLGIARSTTDLLAAWGLLGRRLGTMFTRGVEEVHDEVEDSEDTEEEVALAASATATPAQVVPS